MRITRGIPALKYYSQFFPFRINFVLLLLTGLLCYQLLQNKKIETSSYYGLALLMAKIILVFAGILVSISLLSCLLCWLYFMLGKGANEMQLSADWKSTGSKRLLLRTTLPKALKPFLGFVKSRLVYHRFAMTDQMIIAGRAKNQFISIANGLGSTNELKLPDITAYHFSRALVSFEDFLQLFSFTAVSPIHYDLLNMPDSLLKDTVDMPPKKTEEQVVRIDQLRKVEGEYLNYKKFEDSDDVRRIVWKIFAKNRELVVRTPEVMDPFASHLYFYASFFHQADVMLHDKYHRAMLNHYKNCVWTLFDALRKKEFDVRYISDQEIHAQESEMHPVQVSLALSDWHREKTIPDYFKARSGSVLCLHSFSSEQQVEEALSLCDPATTIFFIRLSRTFRSLYVLHWISRLFFKPPGDELARMKARWVFHPMKFKTLAREKKLSKLIKKYDLNIELV